MSAPLRTVARTRGRHRFIVWSPDDLPIRPAPFASLAAAERGLAAFCTRFAGRPYYASVTGPIPLAELPRHCRITLAGEAR